MGSNGDLTQQVFSSSSTGLLVVDRLRRIVAANPAYYRITGWRPDEIEGGACFEVMDAVTGKGLFLCRENCLSKRSMRSSRAVPRIRAMINTRDGLIKWVELSHSSLDLPGGKEKGHWLIELTEELDHEVSHRELLEFLSPRGAWARHRQLTLL